MPKPDKALVYHEIDVVFLHHPNSKARAEGNNAAWYCHCGDSLPILGRCYYQFGWDNHSICPQCGAKYRVDKDPNKKACLVREY
ncbi:MAG: hypothetical protein H6Q00_1427 [Holophagaceae bacterium]|nr:hypothetical protein [Holophagaceae bacterium]